MEFDWLAHAVSSIPRVNCRRSRRSLNATGRNSSSAHHDRKILTVCRWRNFLIAEEQNTSEDVAAIDSDTTIVIHVDDVTLGGLRTAMQTSNASSDLDLLTHLNQDYIEAVRTSDVRRFGEILADDFLCTQPDGSLIDRAQFLQRTAEIPAVGNLQVYDVNVRLMGDVAIVHARTTFRLSDGTPGSGRYTDVWARRNGHWLAVAAHVTRK